jgi:hypothetical protein
MLRATSDVIEVRRWAEDRGACPCRQEVTGRLSLAYPADCPADTRQIGWDEFEPIFRLSRLVCIYDDAPAGVRFFVGSEVEARRFVSDAEIAHGGMAFV